MRPEVLYPLFAPVTALPGVGPRIAAVIERLAGSHVVDLLWHLPSGLIDRRYAPKVAEARPGAIATLTVHVERHDPAAGSRRPYRVRCSDETGRIILVFFHARADYLQQVLPEGEVRVVSGKVEHFSNQIQMVHPDHIAPPGELAKLKAVEPVYPLTAGLAPKSLAKAIDAALDRAPELSEWGDSTLLARQRWASWRESLAAAHAPEREADLDPLTPARSRLAYDELLANQLALALVRVRLRRLPGTSIRGDGRLRGRVVAALDFTLTGSQRRALLEIEKDMATETRMVRLLQGDVGSGKTVVAVLAMLNAVEADAQAVLMAPTEILARQHFAIVLRLAEAAGVEAALLTGREKGKARRSILAGLASGTVQLVVGTHALLQETVDFQRLALAVVDEQHRFGVHQRLEIAAKGRAVDVLVMTATPIPRTLMLTAYGDMDVSRLTEKPAGRKPIDTRVLPLARLDKVVGAVRRALDSGAKVFWICPLVEESEASDLAAAEARFAHLRELFGESVGLVHGRMKGADKDAVMAGFTEGPITVLVATTVIEVGVDVTDATVMVIEQAERFGLAQLHQMRGRIGRADKPSTCLLLYAPPLTENARARLGILRDTDDGFRIAEEDLRLRGAGELLGTRQSGLPQFRLADLALHADLLAIARDEARLILERDPRLEGPRGGPLRLLLYLFERDATAGFLRSG